MNTMKAIITKSIKFAIVDDTAYKSPDGKNNPINGVTMSVTTTVTSLEAAWSITNVMANPIIPNVLRKSKNSWVNDLLLHVVVQPQKHAGPV